MMLGERSVGGMSAQRRESTQLTIARTTRVEVCRVSAMLARSTLYELPGPRYGRGCFRLARCCAAEEPETGDEWQKPHCYSRVGRWFFRNRGAQGLDC